jgi:CRISPR-associated protein Cmr5
MSNIKTIEAGRASKAFEFAQEGTELTDKKAYKSYLKKLPAYIKVNGLGATLAFMFAKSIGTSDKAKVWAKINDQFTEWLKNRPAHFHTVSVEGKNLALATDTKLAELVINMESHQYRAVTVELLALIGWMRRFADGLIEGEDDSDG